MLIFDRDRRDHPWARAFEDLDAAAEITHRTLAENWRMDPRVSEARESVMLESSRFGANPTGDQWLAGRWTHFQRHICRPPAADASGPASETLDPCNGSNQLGPLPGYDQLVHVKSLNGVLRRLGQPGNLSEDQKEVFEGLTGHPLPERLPGGAGLGESAFSTRVDTIAAEMERRGGAAIQQLAAFVCNALGSTQPLWWACFAEEVRELIAAGDGAGLCRALGLGHVGEGEWLVIWRYDVRWTGSFYRPTVVEAGANPYHHPSPPEARFGVTMPLDTSMAACRELLHRPLSGRFAADGCLGEMIRVEGLEAVNDDRLTELRRRHMKRLQMEFAGEGAREWSERHRTEP